MQRITRLDNANWFRHHPPVGTQCYRYAQIREGCEALANRIIEVTPAGPDQSAAIRKLREVMMTANAAIACGEVTGLEREQGIEGSRDQESTGGQAASGTQAAGISPPPKDPVIPPPPPPPAEEERELTPQGEQALQGIYPPLDAESNGSNGKYGEGI